MLTRCSVRPILLSMNAKTSVFRIEFGFGNYGAIEKNRFGSCSAVLVLHPDDARFIAYIGNSKNCYRVLQSFFRGRARIDKVQVSPRIRRLY